MTNILIPVTGLQPHCARSTTRSLKYPEASFVLLNVQNLGATELAGELMYSDWKELIEQAAAKVLKEAAARLLTFTGQYPLRNRLI